MALDRLIALGIHRDWRGDAPPGEPHPRAGGPGLRRRIGPSGGWPLTFRVALARLGTFAQAFEYPRSSAEIRALPSRKSRPM